MHDLGFRFAHASFCLAYPDELSESVNLLFRDIPPTDPARNEKAIEILREGRSNSYRFLSESGESESFDGSRLVLEKLPFFIQAEIARSLDTGLLIYGAALSAGESIIVFPSLWSADRSMLLSSVVSQGWHFLTDLCAYIEETSSEWHYLNFPPAIDSEYSHQITTLLGQRIESLVHGERLHRLILEPTLPTDTANAPTMIVFPEYRAGAGLTLDPLSSEQAAEGLTKCLSRQTGVFRKQAAAVAQQMPAIKLTFGNASHVENLGSALSYIIEVRPSNSELAALLSAFQPKSIYSVAQSEVENTKSGPVTLAVATPPGAKKVMTVGMATYDDFDGVYFTVQAIRMYHPEISDKTEILVIDNQPDGPAAQQLKNLDKIVANYRYLPFGSRSSTAVRDLVFRQANADFVLCLDSHVMLMPGTLQRLINFFEANPDCSDLLQGPMLAENFKSLHTHFEPVWTKGMYGSWSSDDRAKDPDGPPFEIPMQGLGLFACRKDAWVGLNPRFRGFGGEEGYLHEKFRQRGGKALCLPFLRWLHRFARPGGVPYPINWHDRIFNYMVGIEELGLDPEPMKDHFKDHLGEELGSEILKKVDKEIRSPFFYFDAIYCIIRDTKGSNWRSMKRRFQALEIEAGVRVFKISRTIDDVHLDYAMSHRAIVQEALLQGLENVLILEDDALFLDETLEYLSHSIEELKQRDWNLFFLGGQLGEELDHCGYGRRHLGVPQQVRFTHALAYSKRVFKKIVNDLPDSHKDLFAWLKQQRGYENYLKGIDNQFMAIPAVAATTRLLPIENER